MAFSNATVIPPLPSYTETPQPPLLPYISDKHLTLVLPILAYWGLSMVFHFIDEYDIFPQYRLHTPAEVLKRNRVTRWEVVRDVVIQQIVQMIVGSILAMADPDPYLGKDDYNIAQWAQRLRLAQQGIPVVLNFLGVDSHSLAQSLYRTHPIVSGAVAGGRYPWLTSFVDGVATPAFASWEIQTASAIYWYLIPMCQFAFAILIVDTWQYFLHRAMHMNKWLYTTFHSRHHRLYVPYAFGALYNHPFEGFLLDTLGTGLAYLVSGMTIRQSMWFFTCTTFKTVDDHCGYAFPWDPLQHITSNNAGYHDVHHQSWGIKTNFSQPFFTFWDRLLGTVWTGGDVRARYERTRLAAQQKVDQDSITSSKPIDSVLEPPQPYQDEVINAKFATPEVLLHTAPRIPAGKAAAQATGSREQVLEDESGAGGIQVLADETAEERQDGARLRTTRKHTTTSTPPAGSFKSLSDRVGASFHRRAGGVLGYDSGS